MALLITACGEDGSISVAAEREAIVHGSDDRVDIYALASGELRALALSSSAALLPESLLDRRADGSVRLSARSLGEVYELCPSERFTAQPSVAQCSAVLIDDDLLVTAAHCMSEPWPCERQLWAFGYAVLDAEGSAPVLREEDLYRCRSVPLLRHETDAAGRTLDYAAVQLDRSVTFRDPAPIAGEDLAPGATLTVIGYPSGLPMKVDTGAELIDPRTQSHDYMNIASDTFVSSSGSGVFNARNELVATLARGGADYALKQDAGCYVARHVDGEASSSSPAEQASYVSSLVTQLCEEGWASEALCGRALACGDGPCSLDEHAGNRAGCTIAPERRDSMPSLWCLALALARRRRGPKT